MQFKKNQNIIRLIEQKYSSTTRVSSVDNFKFLHLDFFDPPYPISFKNGQWERVSNPQGTYILGHIFSLDHKNYVVNEDGYYSLEDPQGFYISTLTFPYEENVNITYQVDLRVSSKEPIAESTFDLPEDYNRYDYIKQEKKVLQPNEEIPLSELVNLTVDNKTYSLKLIDIEIDANAVFTTLSNKELVVGETERLTINYINDFSKLKYKGLQLSNTTTLIQQSKEIIITYYYEEV